MFRHRVAVVVAWITLVVAGLPLVPTLPGLLKPGGFEDPSLESSRAARMLAQELGQPGAVLVVIFRADTVGQATRADEAGFLTALEHQVSAAARLPYVERIVTPRERPRQISADRTTAFALIVLRVSADEAARLVPEIRGALGTSPLQPIVTGGPVAYADIIRVSEEDLRRAELISVPLALVALIVVFGSVVAAGIPVAVGGLSVLVALTGLALIGRTIDLSVFVLSLSTMLGLGLGTDYSLFMTSRFREELRAAHSVAQAVERTVEKAGRAVFFSGLTVFIGLLGLVTFDFMMLRSLGIGGALVVVMGVAAALTLLPALLAIVGHRIDAMSIFGWTSSQGALWSRLAWFVMARPWPVLMVVLASLLVLGAPFLRARFSLPDAGVLPEQVESRVGYELLRQKFGEGQVGPIVLTLTAPGSILTDERIDAVFDLSRHIAQDRSVERVESLVDLDPRLTREQYKLLYSGARPAADPYTRAVLDATASGRLTVLTVSPRCASISPECAELVHRLRALRPGSDLEMLVGGGPAAVVDIVDRLYTVFPRAAAMVVVVTYVVLLLLFGSILLPLKAIAMNALSLLASYGALVIVFQEGAGSSLLGFQPLGYVEATLPIIMFCLLFGLSMDYEVFLLTRVREAWDRGLDNAASVAEGLASSGQVITNAALIVVLVSLSFVSADIILVKAVGLGTALAVALDATIVRALLVPATMRLLGDWNWWSPRGLRRLLGTGLGAVLLAVLLTSCASASPPARSTPVPRAIPIATATAGPVLFPRDDAPHDVLTEWWYYTGHLESGNGPAYGFEMVIFQSIRGDGPVGYVAHFAITDSARGRFAYDQKTAIGPRAGPSDVIDLDVGGWSIRGPGGRERIVATMPGYAIDLQLESQKPPVLHNRVGLISFGPAGDSYYYSRTRLAVRGTLVVDGTAMPAGGVAWMDHQWGDFISAGGGWDWFSLHLDDQTELTGSVVRDDVGNPLLVYGTFVDATGGVTHLGPEEFRVESTAWWTSPTTGARYPSGWRLRTEGPRLDLELVPTLVDQELDTRRTTGVAYWEGSVRVAGSRTGRGYVELTGYLR